MSLRPLPVVDTRPFFRPLALEFVRLLRTLDDGQWGRTAVGTWQVRDVLSHLVDTTLRRLSFHRDRHTPPPPDRPVTNPREFTAFINALNAEWVQATRRLGPRVLTDLYAHGSAAFAEFAEHLPLDAPALFPVSWAGQDADAGWLDLGREFAEHWHHQMQVREAVGAGPPSEAVWLRAVLDVAVRALPSAYAGVDAPPDTTVVMHVTGPAGGAWALQRLERNWRLGVAPPDLTGDAGLELDEDAAWRLWFNALPPEAFDTRVRSWGQPELLGPMARARAVIV